MTNRRASSTLAAIGLALVLVSCRGSEAVPVDAGGLEAAVADTTVAEEAPGPGPSRVEVFPAAPSVRTGSALQLVAHIGGGSVNQLTVWSVVEPDCGSVVEGAMVVRYLAPATAGVCTVRARAVVDGVSFTDARITVNAAVGPELRIVPAGPDVEGVRWGAPIRVGSPQSYMVVEEGTGAAVPVEWSTFRTAAGVMTLAGGTLSSNEPGYLVLLVKAADGRATAAGVLVQE